MVWLEVRVLSGHTAHFAGIFAGSNAGRAVSAAGRGRDVQPFLDAWRGAGPNGLALYEAGSEGPNEADQLLARDGRRWRPVDRPIRQVISAASFQQVRALTG